MNTFGTLFRLSIFGESHGPGVGVVLDGIPPGLEIDLEEIQQELDRRRPGTSPLSSARKETDAPKILSGVFQGKATGAPLTLFIENVDVQSQAYESIRDVPRPGHADYPAQIKFRGFNDYRGGGMFSGRLTAPLVAAGAIAKKILSPLGIHIVSHTLRIGPVALQESYDPATVQERPRYGSLQCLCEELSNQMTQEIERARKEGNSVGGVIECIATGLPVGWGEPFFDSVEGELAKLLFAIPAVKGVEFGAGFQAASSRGSQNNDAYDIQDGKVVIQTNHAGGILGGLTSGAPLVLRVAMKPPSSIAQRQTSVNLNTHRREEIVVKGRHDPCVVPRALVVVEAATAIVLTDFFLRARSQFLP